MAKAEQLALEAKAEQPAPEEQAELAALAEQPARAESKAPTNHNRRGLEANA